MRRSAAALMIGSLISGCFSYDAGPETGGHRCGPGGYGKAHSPPSIPGMVGANGAPVGMTGPYAYGPPPSELQAKMMMRQSIPLSAMSMSPGPGGMPVYAPVGMGSMPGMGGGPGMPGMQGMPAMGMPGMNPPLQPTSGVMPASGPGPGGGGPDAFRFSSQRTQVRFDRPTGMKVAWFAQGADGRPAYSQYPVETPGRYNFGQGAIYRLKLSHIDGYPELEIYPTMEVVPVSPKSEAFLAHSAVPVSFTPDDFKQVRDGSYLVKVIYLPDPQYQEAGGAALDEIISTRLDPGVDPVAEAARRGCILLIIRMGNVDQEAPNTPGLNVPLNGSGPPAPASSPLWPGQPGMQVPYQMTPMGQAPGLPSLPPSFASKPGAMPNLLPPKVAETPVSAPVQKVPALPVGNPLLLPSSQIPVELPGVKTASETTPLPMPPTIPEGVAPPPMAPSVAPPPVAPPPMLPMLPSAPFVELPGSGIAPPPMLPKQ